MNNKNNRVFHKNIKYSENVFAKKILKEIRFSDILFYLIYIMLTLLYSSLIFVKISTGALLLISILYFLILLNLSLSQKAYTKKVINEVLNISISPEAFLNLNLYNANKKICTKKAYDYYLNNIAKSYILLGETNKANNIIKYLDKQNKNMVLQGEVLQNKIEIAFLKKDLKDFNKQCDNLNKILKFLPRKFRENSRFNIKLKQAVLEKKLEELNDLCDNIKVKNNKYLNIIFNYYKGCVLEAKKEDINNEFYKYVAENGNNLLIANEVRKKLNIKDKKEIYKRKKHIIYKCYKVLIFVIVIFISIIWIKVLLKK